MILLPLAASIAGLAVFLIKTNVFGEAITADAWLGFWSSVLGSVVTIVGIGLTFFFENVKANEDRKMESQPILTIQNVKGKPENVTKDEAFQIEFPGTGDRIIAKMPHIRITNIGKDFATKVQISFVSRNNWFSFDKLDFDGNSRTVLIKENESVIFPMKLLLHKDGYHDLFNDTVKYGTDDFYKKISCFVDEFSLDDSKILETGNLRYAEGELLVGFEDIYRNKYYQKRKAKLYIWALNTQLYANIECLDVAINYNYKTPSFVKRIIPKGRIGNNVKWTYLPLEKNL